MRKVLSDIEFWIFDILTLHDNSAFEMFSTFIKDKFNVAFKSAAIYINLQQNKKSRQFRILVNRHLHEAQI